MRVQRPGKFSDRFRIDYRPDPSQRMVFRYKLLRRNSVQKQVVCFRCSYHRFPLQFQGEFYQIFIEKGLSLSLSAAC